MPLKYIWDFAISRACKYKFETRNGSPFLYWHVENIRAMYFKPTILGRVFEYLKISLLQSATWLLVHMFAVYKCGQILAYT